MRICSICLQFAIFLSLSYSFVSLVFFFGGGGGGGGGELKSAAAMAATVPTPLICKEKPAYIIPTCMSMCNVAQVYRSRVHIYTSLMNTVVVYPTGLCRRGGMCM